jgi:hypothetical protein
LNRQFTQIPSFQDAEYSPAHLQVGTLSAQYHQTEQDSVVAQDTVLLATVGRPASTFSHKVLDKLPVPVRHMIVAVLTRVRDPEPEGSLANSQEGAGSPAIALGWLPILTLTSTLGMLSVAYAYNNSRYGGTVSDTFFLLGVLLIFAPVVMRLLSPAPSHFERISLLCVVGICLYLVKVMTSPLYFSFYDEFLHWRTADDIARSGHLFGENALLPVSPDYPGLEIVTNALSTQSGLSTFQAGIVVIGVARAVMILALFMLNEQIMRSARMAGIATIIYMTNPHFLFFDAQFAYESLALPLITFVMFALAPHQMISVRLNRLEPIAPLIIFAKTNRKWLSSDLRRITFTAWLVLGAAVLTHHVTDFFFDGLLVCWTVAYGFLRLTPVRRSNLTKTALLGVFMSIACIVRVGNPVVGYLSSFLGNALNELGHVLTGTSGARHLFVNYTGQVTPIWERVITISSVALISLCLPFGLLCLWQRYRSNALAYTFGIVSFAYPLSQVFRFTNVGGELVDRAAAFLFIPIASVLAIFITQFWSTRRLSWKHTFLISCAASVVFLGGIILASGPSFALLPGPYLVTADNRSIEPEGIQAAMWARSYLGPNNRMATDRINQILMGTYGEQRLVTGLEDNVDVSAIFTSSSLDPDELSTLRSAKVHYLVVDLRLAKALPLEGYYFDEGESGSFQYTTPIDLEALTKFSTIPQINRVFDSGDIVIYDVGGLINASEKP